MNPFSAIFVPDELAEALSDDAWLAGLLEVELALVNAQSLVGAVPAAAAAAVAEACVASLYAADEIGREGRAAGNPVEPLVRAMRERVGEENAGFVHRGATSQDILDSAAMLVARNAARLIDADLEGLADACAGLAERHRGTVMAARTLLQQAVPTTFGFKAATWLSGVVEARNRLRDAAADLPSQLGGAAGTLAAFGESGPEVARLFAAELDLREPDVPWHAVRLPVAGLGGALATAAGVVAKIALDVTLLAQTEVAEASEGDTGVSTTMPHKRNPTQAILALACARHARANAALLVESLVVEHERPTGAWHAEWHALNSALAATGGAAAATRRSLESLQVDADRMRANLVGDDAVRGRTARRRGGAARGLPRQRGRVHRPRARRVTGRDGRAVRIARLDHGDVGLAVAGARRRRRARRPPRARRRSVVDVRRHRGSRRARPRRGRRQVLASSGSRSEAPSACASPHRTPNASSGSYSRARRRASASLTSGASGRRSSGGGARGDRRRRDVPLVR